MNFILEAFQTPESRKAFFARLRKGMGKYPRGKYRATEYLHREKGGVRYLGYEDQGKVKEAGPVKGLLDPEKLMRRLKAVRNVKGALQTPDRPKAFRDWEVSSVRLTKEQKDQVARVKASLAKKGIIGSAFSVKGKKNADRVQKSGILETGMKGSIRKIPKGHNAATDLWNKMDPSQRARAMGLDPSVGGFTLRKWADLSQSEREYVTREDRADSFLSTAMFGERKRLKKAIRTALASGIQPESETVHKEFGISLNTPGGVLRAFNRMIQRQAEGKATEDDRIAFTKKLYAQGWGRDEVQGFEQRAGFNTKFWKAVSKISVKKQRGTLTPKLAVVSKSLGLKVRKSDFRNTGDLAPTTRYGTNMEGAINSALSKLKEENRARRLEALRLGREKALLARRAKVKKK